MLGSFTCAAWILPGPDLRYWLPAAARRSNSWLGLTQVVRPASQRNANTKSPETRLTGPDIHRCRINSFIFKTLIIFMTSILSTGLDNTNRSFLCQAVSTNEEINLLKNALCFCSYSTCKKTEAGEKEGLFANKFIVTACIIIYRE